MIIVGLTTIPERLEKGIIKNIYVSAMCRKFCIFFIIIIKIGKKYNKL